jgi:hypothetical protein
LHCTTVLKLFCFCPAPRCSPFGLSSFAANAAADADAATFRVQEEVQVQRRLLQVCNVGSARFICIC